MKVIRCPECRAVLEESDHFEEGDIVYCPTCDIELEIVDSDPLRLREFKVVEDDEKDSEDILNCH